MKENLNNILEPILKILMFLVIVLILIGAFTVGKRFAIQIHNNVETLPIYEEHEPKDVK